MHYKNLFVLIFIYMGALLAYMSVHLVCVVPTGAQKGHQILWSWSYRHLLASMRMLGTEPQSSARAVSALNHRAISAATHVCVLKYDVSYHTMVRTV